jgi:hypothetical protein
VREYYDSQLYDGYVASMAVIFMWGNRKQHTLTRVAAGWKYNRLCGHMTANNRNFFASDAWYTQYSSLTFQSLLVT